MAVFFSLPVPKETTRVHPTFKVYESMHPTERGPCCVPLCASKCECVAGYVNSVLREQLKTSV